MRAFGLSTFILMTFVVSAHAASPTCDAGFEARMNNRAHMEAQREVEVAEYLFSKPESILEYSCFKVQADMAASAVSGASGLVGGTIHEPLATYFDKNFSGSTGENCSIMNDIWVMAKCHNFERDMYFRNFRTFADTDDLRSCGGDDEEAVAEAKEAYKAMWEGFAEQASRNVILADEVDTMLDQVKPESCDSIDPKATGLAFGDGAYDEGPEQTCLAAGCTYDPEAQKCF